MIRKSATAWLALLFLSASGCTSFQDCVVDIETDARNCVLAEKGWLHWSRCYSGIENKHHFAKGFKEGYQNILEGGKGCQPTLPPRWYWKPCYQSAAGRCKIAAWFDGFSHGAVAAQQDGYGNLQQLPISPTAKANWMTRQAPASNACFAEMEPKAIVEEEQLLPPEIHNSNASDEPMIEMPPQALEGPADSEIKYDDPSGSLEN